jgi:hypothetical protein
VNDRLLAYVSGALDPTEEEAFEEALFNDEKLADDAAGLVTKLDTLRFMAKDGPLTPVVTDAELRALEAKSRVMRYRPIEGAVRSRLRDEDFAVVQILLEAEPERVHVLFCTTEGIPYFRVNDAPFERSSREVLVLCKREVAIAHGSLIMKVVDDRDVVLASVVVDNEP